MLAFLLYRVLCGLLRLLVRVGVDDRDLEMAVLRHQLRILWRRGKRAGYRTADRALLVAASRFLPRERWSAFPVVPDTLNRWRRQLLRRKGSNRCRPGRPVIDLKVRELILRMAKENARWGYLRIKGELLKLGITVSAMTIANLLRRGGLGPAPRRIGPTWSQFLRAQALAISATGGRPGSDQEDRDCQGQAPTPPAPDSGDRPSLQREWSPDDAVAASAPIGVSDRGRELPSAMRQNRPVRMLAARSFPLGSVCPPTGRPPLGFLLPNRVTEGLPLARVCASRLNRGRRPVRSPSSPARQH